MGTVPVGVTVASLGVLGAPGALEVARQAEGLGYRSVWVAEANGMEAFSLLGALGAAAPTLSLGTGVIPIQVRTPLLVAMAGAAAAAAALLGAVFLLVSLIVPRALLAGMIYIFAWESLLGRFLPGVRAISSREHALRVFDGILDDDFSDASNAALTMLIIAVVCLLLAAWRLRTLQLD